MPSMANLRFHFCHFPIEEKFHIGSWILAIILICMKIHSAVRILVEGRIVTIITVIFLNHEVNLPKRRAFRYTVL